MDGESVEFRSFLQDVHNKVTIALAIAVIRSKPENLSTEEYLRDLRSTVLKEWQKNEIPDIFEDKLVSLSWNKVAKDVGEVLPNSPTVESDDSPIDPAISKILQDTHHRSKSPTPVPDEEIIAQHGSFFKALVRLKFAVETQKTVPFNCVRNFIREAKNQYCSPKQSPSEDSGVVSSAATGSKAPNSVSSSLFKSITHSADTEALIAKSAVSLLSYVRFAFFNTPYDSYCRWKGSLLEKTCDILAGATTDPQCCTVVSSFVGTSLDQIWTVDDVVKSFAIEHQLLMLTMLCRIADVCSSALNNVMLKFEEFVETFPPNSPPPLIQAHKIEKIPYFLKFAEILFSNWREVVGKTRKSDVLMSNKSSSTLKTLWRLNTSLMDGQLEKNKILLSSWRETLERLSIASIESHPLVNSYLLKTLSVVDALVGTMEPQEESDFFFDTVGGDGL